MTFTGGLPSILTSNTSRRADIHIDTLRSDIVIEIQETIGTTPSPNYLSLYAKSDKQLYIQNDSGVETQISGGITSLGSSTDNAVVRWDTTSGTILQDSLLIISDTGDLTGLTGILLDGANDVDLISSNASSNAINLFTSVSNIRLSGQAGLNLIGVAGDVNISALSNTVDITGNIIELNTLSVDSAGDIQRSGSDYLHTGGTSGNQFLGIDAGTANTGSNNTAIGSTALAAITSQDDCTSVGFESLLVNTVSENTAIGSQALKTNTTGTKCTAVGFTALSGSNAANCTAVGHEAMHAATTAENCTAVGVSAISAIATGNNNNSFGAFSLNALTSGADNSLYGNTAGRLITTSSGNAGFGHANLFSLVSGSGQNVAIGKGTLDSIVTGNNNTAIGTNSGSALTLADSNNIMIKNDGVVADSNTIRLGNATHTSLFLAGTVSELASSKPMTINDSTGQIGFSDGVELQTGIISGGILSINADDTLFDITSGSGHIWNSSTQELIHVSWNELLGQSTTYVGIQTFVSIGSGGSPTYSATALSNEDKRSVIFLGELIHLNSINLFLTTTQPIPIYNTGAQISDLMAGLGILNILNNTISAPAANLTVAKSSGKIMDHAINYENSGGFDNPHIIALDALNTNVSDTFAYLYQDLSTSQGNTVIIPGSYDDGNGVGSPGSVASNQFTTQRIMIGGSNQLQILPGQFLYSNLCESQDAVDIEGFQISSKISSELVLIAYLTVKGNATDLTDEKQASIVQAGKFGGQIGGGVISAAGNDKELMFNSGGALTGDSLLLWDTATSDMTINGLVIDINSNITKSASTYLHEPNATSAGFGSGNLTLITTGARNSAFGVGCLDAITTGTDNVCMGFEAAKNLTTNNSDNIMIANDGKGGDSGFVRLGNSGDHTDTFLVGNQWATQGASTDLGDTTPSVTTAQIKTFILRGTPTAGRAWTLPTALLMIGTDLNNPQVNDCLDFVIINEATGFDITITIPGDVTAFGSMVVGDAVALSVSSTFRIRLTNITPASEAYQIFRLS